MSSYDGKCSRFLYRVRPFHEQELQAPAKLCSKRPSCSRVPPSTSLPSHPTLPSIVDYTVYIFISRTFLFHENFKTSAQLFNTCSNNILLAVLWQSLTCYWNCNWRVRKRTRKPCCCRETARCCCKFWSIRSVQAVVYFVWYFSGRWHVPFGVQSMM